MSRTVECARSAGLLVENYREVWSGLMVDFRVGAEDPNDLRFFDDCYEQHASYVDQVYQLSIERQIYELERPVVECIRDSGVDVTAVPHPVTGAPVDASTLALGRLLVEMSGPEFVRVGHCLP